MGLSLSEFKIHYEIINKEIIMVGKKQNQGTIIEHL